MNPLGRHTILFALLIAFVIVAFSPHRNGSAHSTSSLEAVADVAKDNPQNSIVAGFDFSNLDRSANACQDFNQFANGGWIAKNQIPAAYSRWGRVEVLGEQNLDALHGILDGLLKKKSHAAGSNEQKVADFYASCMDEQKIES